MSYRDLLKREYDRRSKQNPSYSLRAFARDLGILPSHLTKVLQGTYGISGKNAKTFASRLQLSTEEARYFNDSVMSLHARSRLAREAARTRLLKYESGNFNSLSLDYFSTISDWYHFAILELLELDGAKNNPAWIAKALDLPEDTVTKALERLLRIGLLEGHLERFTLKKETSFLATRSEVPSDAIKSFHRQILTLAEKALSTQKMEDRDFSAVTMCIARSSIPKLKSKLRTFLQQVNREFSVQSDKKDALYCLSVQLFSLMASESRRGSDDEA